LAELKEILKAAWKADTMEKILVEEKEHKLVDYLVLKQVGWKVEILADQLVGELADVTG
jgi:hypothetical protein